MLKTWLCMDTNTISCTSLSSLLPPPLSCFVLWLTAWALWAAVLLSVHAAPTVTGSQPGKWIPGHYNTINNHHPQACQSKLTRYVLVEHGSQSLLKQFLLLIYKIWFSTISYMAVSANHWNSAWLRQNTSWADALLRASTEQPRFIPSSVPLSTSTLTLLKHSSYKSTTQSTVVSEFSVLWKKVSIRGRCRCI